MTHAHRWLIESPEDARAAGRDHMLACCRCRARRTYRLRLPERYRGIMPPGVVQQLRDR